MANVNVWCLESGINGKPDKDVTTFLTNHKMFYILRSDNTAHTNIALMSVKGNCIVVIGYGDITGADNDTYFKFQCGDVTYHFVHWDPTNSTSLLGNYTAM